MPLFGSHLSISGGYYKAVETAAALGMDTVNFLQRTTTDGRAKNCQRTTFVCFAKPSKEPEFDIRVLTTVI